MILKLLKAVWFLSLMGFMAIFMYIYASLPVDVALSEGIDRVVISKDMVFYISIIIVSLVNVLVFAVAKLYGNKDEHFSIWFYGQIILLNFFFCTVLGFINVFNSGEKFEFERLGIVIYGSILLIILWAVAWPVYSLSRKFLSKQVV